MNYSNNKYDRDLICKLKKIVGGNLKSVESDSRNINKKTFEEIKKLGFSITEFRTAYGNYICSGRIKIIDSRKNKFYTNDKLYFAVGIANRQYGYGKVYRGYAKEIQDSENLSSEEVKKLNIYGEQLLKEIFGIA